MGVAALGAALIIPQFYTYCCGGRAYDSVAKANLHNVFLACKAYWADNGSANNCTPAIASQPEEYGYIQSADVVVSGSGPETDFLVIAKNNNSDNTFSIDSNGTITPSLTENSKQSKIAIWPQNKNRILEGPRG